MVLVGLLLQLELWKDNIPSSTDRYSHSANSLFWTAYRLTTAVTVVMAVTLELLCSLLRERQGFQLNSITLTMQSNNLSAGKLNRVGNTCTFEYKSLNILSYTFYHVSI